MKRFLINLMITSGLLLILLGLIIVRRDDINTLINKYLSPNKNIELTNKNEYYREYNFSFVQNTDNFNPKDYQDILNIYYTVINSGNEIFTFYCDSEYTDCIEDVGEIANDKGLLSDINNYVHPYNAYSNIETEYDTLGKVTIKLTRNYTKDEIDKINKKVDELYSKLVTSDNVRDNIKNVHDYIINNSKYDSNRSDNNVVDYRSDIAYGPLFDGYAICGGYTDLMQLFLEKMDLKCYRVSSKSHIWNAVEIDNKWYHIDLTWDDPVVSDGKDYLNHDYFLITTNDLINKEKTQHDFNEKRFVEMKRS